MMEMVRSLVASVLVLLCVMAVPLTLGMLARHSHGPALAWHGNKAVMVRVADAR